MILPGHEDPPNVGRSEWDQKLGEMEYVLLLCDEMIQDEMRVYLPRGLPNKYSPSLRPPPPYLYIRTPAIAQSSAKLSGSGGEKQIIAPQRAQECAWEVLES